MLPTLPFDYRSDRVGMNSKFLSQLINVRDEVAAPFVSATDVSDLILSELGVVPMLPLRLATLLISVCCVLLSGTYKKVIRVYAKSVIAFMADYLPVLYGPEVDYPRILMGSLVPRTYLMMPVVPVFPWLSGPLPASSMDRMQRSVLINFSPETSNGGRTRIDTRRHDTTPLVVPRGFSGRLVGFQLFGCLLAA